jgi:hypothetical protein
MSIKHLSHEQKSSVLKDFPNIKLSYETIVHKKVNQYDFIYAIPQGRKCFVWFRMYENNPVCFLMNFEMNKNVHTITDVSIYPCCFDKRLAYVGGTVFYGTQFYRFPDKEQIFFTIQDVFYYKSKDVSVNSMKDKLCLIRDMFEKEKELKQVAYTKNFIVLGMPVSTNSWREMESILDKISYRVSFFQFRKYDSYTKDSVFAVRFIDKDTNVNTCFENQKQNEIPKQTKHVKPTFQVNQVTQFKPVTQVQSKTIPQQQQMKSAIFLVKPDIETDIYHLYCKHKDVDGYYFNIACVPDYKTSVLMNKLFRNIKENENLDSLEESDDEEEFENDKAYKYVYLDRKFYMYCVFNMKFKKWTPVRLAATYEIKNLCDYNDVSKNL